ncbi:protein FAR1-RELATED SEQUENCE 5-like [Spinacia oleracea]|uniref:Protein FAR1-RELATED SEQUENCE 5-like n=1 Tax=Spinacia oleracea TaxID=3562 RepID=A0A9R0JQP3_SPIOL|nr:protein FAR1-RELATED SEQUENCE 5-like [Spinacia oleracea]
MATRDDEEAHDDKAAHDEDAHSDKVAHDVTDNNQIDEMDIDLDVGQEANSSDLLGIEVKSDKEAYEIYNNYAYQKGFSVRKGKFRKRSDQVTIFMRQFVCSYEGFKGKSVEPKVYNKLDTRTGCKAFRQFDVDKLGVYICVKHGMVHNHDMVSKDKRQWLRSHREVTSQQLSFISSLKESGIPVADAIRHMIKEVGGRDTLGFIPWDAYNALHKQKEGKIEGCDTNQLIKMFRQREAEECDFYYDFEVDDGGHIVNFLWRDGRMRRGYDIFGDLLVHDTTYRTNKYDMICGPFVGMNHHSKNIMFGVGFIYNEKTGSFVWLFHTILKSIGGRAPVTIITD